VQFERALELAPDLLQGHIFSESCWVISGAGAAKVHLKSALALDRRNKVNKHQHRPRRIRGPATTKVHLEQPKFQIQPGYALTAISTVLTKLGDHKQAKIHHEHQ
jgi:hypothetical protein